MWVCSYFSNSWDLFHLNDANRWAVSSYFGGLPYEEYTNFRNINFFCGSIIIEFLCSMFLYLSDFSFPFPRYGLGSFEIGEHSLFQPLLISNPLVME